MHRALTGALLTALAAAGFAGCADAPDRPDTTERGAHAAASVPASVLLVTIDTLRADRVVPGGPMPRLMSLAQHGFRFTTVHTPAPLTLPAHTSLLTGLGPQQHGVRDNIGYALPPQVPTVAEAFAHAGAATAAFIGGYPLDHAFGLARGFALYDDRMTRSAGKSQEGHTERRADEVVDAALAWLAGHGEGRFFVWVHLFDPHDPYEAPPSHRGRGNTRYDEEVAYVDDALARLVEGVRGRPGGAPWIVVAGDHGEALGDHGEATHGIFLYEATMRVPLVIVPPVAPATPGVIEASVGLVDVAPTLLELGGLPAPPTGARSLVPLLGDRAAGASFEARALYLESIHARRRYGWAPLTGFVEWPRKFVAAPAPELYDLREDPGEVANRFDRAQAGPLVQRLAELRAAPGAALTASDPGLAVDVARLESLGYVGGSGVASPDDALADRRRPDPKQRIAAIPPIDRGLAAMAEGRNADALRAFEAALAIDPDNVLVLNDLGLLALRSGDLPRAERFFRDALGRDEHAETAANNLGLALGGLERYAEAEQAFRRALTVRPGYTVARFNLAVMLERQGSLRDALAELGRVESEQPDFPGLADRMAELRRAVGTSAGR
jgi:arylsulfatase A-like enzyme/Tfp pilus assembly protein PilF